MRMGVNIGKYSPLGVFLVIFGPAFSCKRKDTHLDMVHLKNNSRFFLASEFYQKICRIVFFVFCFLMIPINACFGLTSQGSLYNVD